MSEVLFLRNDEVIGLASSEEYLSAVRAGYRDVATGGDVTLRVTTSANAPSRIQNYTAVLPAAGVMGGYLYGSGSDQWYLAPLFDATTAEPLALVDGAALSPYKTGAVCGLSINIFAREDVATVALAGTGPQAQSQLRYAAVVHNLDQAWVTSLHRDERESFAAWATNELEIPVKAVDNIDAVIPDADLVITATDSHVPVFDGSLLSPGTHVVAMGASDPEERELDTTAVARATYVPDLHERALAESGELAGAIAAGAVTEDHVHADLAAVVAGEAPGRQSDEEITVFDSGGTAIETTAATDLVYRTARETGVGTKIQLGSLSETFAGEW